MMLIPVTPVVSLITLVNLIFICCNAFCIRWISAPQERIKLSR